MQQSCVVKYVWKVQIFISILLWNVNGNFEFCSEFPTLNIAGNFKLHDNFLHLNLAHSWMFNFSRKCDHSCGCELYRNLSGKLVFQ